MWKLLRVLPKFASVWKKSSATDFAQAQNLPFPVTPVTEISQILIGFVQSVSIFPFLYWSLIV